VIENVKGAQPWVGRAKWHYGSFYLWGDVPALMPKGSKGSKGIPHAPTGHWTNPSENGGKGFTKRFEDTPMAWLSSRSNARKAASAQIAKIPFPLAQHIAQVFKP
jgi:hypothetical protein